MENNKPSMVKAVFRLVTALIWLSVPVLAFGADANPNVLGGPHIMPKLDSPAAKRSLPLASSFHLNYYGGRVVSNLKVVQVLWGTGGVGTGNGQFLAQVKNSTDSPSIATFYQSVLNSAYVTWLTEYNTDIIDFGGSQGTNQTIGEGDFVGQFVITPSNTNTTIDDTDIQTELANQITGGHLPAPTTDADGNSNTYYAIFFPHGMSINLGSSASCVSGGFCAYHGTIANVGGHEIYYGVHPDMQSGSGCSNGCGSNPTTFENQTSVASHELIETITDPEVGVACCFSPPLAWYDPNNGEIGDICNGEDATIVGGDGLSYAVQKEFSNSQNNCIAPSGAAPTPTATPTGGPTPTPTPTATPTPSLKIAPSKFNFGKVTATAAQGRTHTFTVSNKGSVPAVLGTISAALVATSASSFQVSPGTCVGTISPKKNCKLSVTFAPTLADGAESGSLSVAYDAGTAGATLSGTSTPATLSAPKTVTLKGAPPSGTGLPKTVKIINHSKVPITAGATPTLPDFTIAPDNCTGLTLNHGDSCTLEIATTPGGGTVSGQSLNEALSYPFSYGSNSGNVPITLKSKVSSN